jgi:hypothetical protein
MPSMKNSKPEESPGISARQRMRDALANWKMPPPPLPPRKPLPKEIEEMDFAEWAEKLGHEAADNINRSVLKKRSAKT